MNEKALTSSERWSAKYGDAISDASVKQSAEAFDTGYSQSIISKWQNPEEVNYNIPLCAAVNSRVGIRLISEAAQEVGGYFIVIGKHQSESVQEAISNICNCISTLVIESDPAKIEAGFECIIKHSELAIGK